MDFLSGTNISLNVVFRTKDQSLVPDLNSVRLNLRGHDGTLLITNQLVTVPVDANRVTVSIAAFYNNLDVGQKFGRRTAHITYTSNGQTFNQYYTYRLLPWLNHSIDEDKVRYLLGANFNDLPDDSIDIVKAYYQVEESLAEDNIDLEDQLITGGMSEFYANDAIACWAALNALPSLRLAASVQEDNGSISFRRYADVEWDALEESLRSRLSTSLATLTSSEVPSATLLVFATRPDPVTGG